MLFQLLVVLFPCVNAINPLIAHVGMADPHMHIWEGPNSSRVYLYATHDTPKPHAGQVGFRMTNWWVWSSEDLVNWKMEDIVEPNSTLSWDNVTDECWATDAATRNGSTYFYLSVGPKQIGVVKSSTYTGPWEA